MKSIRVNLSPGFKSKRHCRRRAEPRDTQYIARGHASRFCSRHSDPGTASARGTVIARCTRLPRGLIRVELGLALALNCRVAPRTWNAPGCPALRIEMLTVRLLLKLSTKCKQEIAREELSMLLFFPERLGAGEANRTPDPNLGNGIQLIR